MPFLNPTKPWTMCSPKEASDRVAFKELSQFECTSSTYASHVHPRNRQPDPFKCVKKYRRSAAGGGVNDNDPDVEAERSILDLKLCVDYLLGTIFARQQSDGMTEQFSLVKTVNFVDDRLRAVQVDLTTLLGQMKMSGSTCTTTSTGRGSCISAVDGETWTTVRGMQVKLVRYNILAQYMLSNVGSDMYEWKFSQKALTTAISSFFASFHGTNGRVGSREHLDEVMSYAALLHLATVVKKQEGALPQTSSTGQQCGLVLDGGEGISSILGIYRKYVPTRTCAAQPARRVGFGDRDGNYPKYHWALRVVSEIENGNLLQAIHLLSPLHDCENNNADGHDNGTKFSSEERWRVVSRCCVAQVMPILRIGLIRRYNKSFGKQEKVKITDIAQLLRFPSPEEALIFCQNVGLPTVSSGQSGALPHDRVVMKSAPISITGENIAKMTNPGRSEDAFVLGHTQWLVENKETPQIEVSINSAGIDTAKSEQNTPKSTMSSLQIAMMKMKVGDKSNNDPDEIELDDDDDKSNKDPDEIELDDDDDDDDGPQEFHRLDADGVAIFPSDAMRNLVG